LGSLHAVGCELRTARRLPRSALAADAQVVRPQVVPLPMGSRMRWPLLAIVALVPQLATKPLPAQTSAVGRTAADSAVAAVGRRLRSSPDYVSAARTSSEDVLDVIGPLRVGRLNDSTASLVLPLLGETIGSLPIESCGFLVGGPNWQHSAGVLDLLSKMTPRLLQGWMELFEAIALANVRGDPEHPRPSAQDTQAVMAVALLSIPKDDLLRLSTTIEDPTPSPSDQCWASERVLVAMAGLPVASQLVALRANFP